MKNNFFCIITLISAVFAGCTAKSAVIKMEPSPEVLIKKITPHDRKLCINDSARSNDFQAALKKISKITLKFNGTGEEYIPWKNSLEKNLLRLGILISEEPKKDPLLESNDEIKEIKSDAVLLIDRISLIKIDSEKSADDFMENNFSDYKFSFFVAEISGKIILKNGDVIWNSTVSVSSFDLLKIYDSINPEISFRKSSKYRYSEKLGEWIQDGWNFSAEDNFQKSFRSSFDESRHRNELIEMAVSGFIGNIKSGNEVSSR
jgi:hypothetical protein